MSIKSSISCVNSPSGKEAPADISIAAFKRDYDSAFGKIADILKKYGIVENARNLRFRFILCMQEFFDSIPQDQWKTKDATFIKESEEFSINKFREWVIEQIT